MGARTSAVFRPSTATWFVRGAAAIRFGGPNDKPVARDYDGDDRADIAVYRPSTGTWHVRGHSPIQFGASTDLPVPAFYLGDGDADIAVFRPSTSTWHFRSVSSVIYGASGDIPVPGTTTAIEETSLFGFLRLARGTSGDEKVTTLAYGNRIDRGEARLQAKAGA